MKLSDLFRICDDWHDYQTAGHDVNYKFKEEGDSLYIYFQGSSSIWDWVRNFLFRKRPYKDMKLPYRVHGGFLSAWKEVEDIIIAKVTERERFGAWKYKWNHITVVGYSHGGALAFFTTECIWYHRPDLRDGGFEGYAFESPRVFGGFKIPRDLRERWKQLTVVRVGCDIVTHCPPVLFGFCHAGKILKLRGNPKLVENNLPKFIKYHYPQVVFQALVDYENNLGDC